ncbi:hypothetical protein CYMTET_39176, partial [Cymbomonas tetramitiformis]
METNWDDVARVTSKAFCIFLLIASGIGLVVNVILRRSGRGHLGVHIIHFLYSSAYVWEAWFTLNTPYSVTVSQLAHYLYVCALVTVLCVWTNLVMPSTCRVRNKRKRRAVLIMVAYFNFQVVYVCLLWNHVKKKDRKFFGSSDFRFDLFEECYPRKDSETGNWKVEFPCDLEYFFIEKIVRGALWMLLAVSYFAVGIGTFRSLSRIIQSHIRPDTPDSSFNYANYRNPIRRLFEYIKFNHVLLQLPAIFTFSAVCMLVVGSRWLAEGILYVKNDDITLSPLMGSFMRMALYLFLHYVVEICPAVMVLVIMWRANQIEVDGAISLHDEHDHHRARGLLEPLNIHVHPASNVISDAYLTISDTYEPPYEPPVAVSFAQEDRSERRHAPSAHEASSNGMGLSTFEAMTSPAEDGKRPLTPRTLEEVQEIEARGLLGFGEEEEEVAELDEVHAQSPPINRERSGGSVDLNSDTAGILFIRQEDEEGSTSQKQGSPGFEAASAHETSRLRPAYSLQTSSLQSSSLQSSVSGLLSAAGSNREFSTKEEQIQKTNRVVVSSQLNGLHFFDELVIR